MKRKNKTLITNAKFKSMVYQLAKNFMLKGIFYDDIYDRLFNSFYYERINNLFIEYSETFDTTLGYYLLEHPNEIVHIKNNFSKEDLNK